LLARGEEDRDEDFPGLAAEGGILEAGEEIGIERAEASGRRGKRRLAIRGEAFPEFILVAAERVEGERDLRLVARISSLQRMLDLAASRGLQVIVLTCTHRTTRPLGQGKSG